MPKKFKLSPGVSHEYTIFGVACHLKDYRFTFFLNEKMNFHLKRIEDLKIGERDSALSYSLFLYRHPDERRSYYLISNYHESGRLIPEERGADYFLIIDDALTSTQKKRLVTKIQSVSQVLASYEIPAGKAKNLEAIFGELELHLL